MDKAGSVAYLVGGAVIGWVASRWGGYGPGYGYGAYGGGCAPAPCAGFPAPYGYGGYPHGCDPFTEKRLACLEAENAANQVAIKKDEKIAFLEDKILEERLEGKIFKATCHKPNGKVFLTPSHLADPYRAEPQYIDTHTHGHDPVGEWL